MADTFLLRISTPEGPVLQEEVSSVTIVNSEGEIGVLPGHVRYMSLLGTGVLSYVTAQGGVNRLVASEGFCHMTDGILTVLTDRVVTKEQASEIDLLSEKSRAAAALEGANFVDSAWDIKRTELKIFEAIEQLVSN